MLYTALFAYLERAANSNLKSIWTAPHLLFPLLNMLGEAVPEDSES